MNVIIKKNLIVFRDFPTWLQVREKVKTNHGDKIFAISWRLKRELGFTVRQHKGLVPHDKGNWEIMKAEGWPHRYHYEDQIHLDFYNEAQMTMFVIKYLNT